MDKRLMYRSVSGELLSENLKRRMKSPMMSRIDPARKRYGFISPLK